MFQVVVAGVSRDVNTDMSRKTQSECETQMTAAVSIKLK